MVRGPRLGPLDCTAKTSARENVVAAHKRPVVRSVRVPALYRPSCRALGLACGFYRAGTLKREGRYACTPAQCGNFRSRNGAFRVPGSNSLQKTEATSIDVERFTRSGTSRRISVAAILSPSTARTALHMTCKILAIDGVPELFTMNNI